MGLDAIMNSKKEKTMKEFIALLTNSEYGVEVPYAHGYTAFVSPDDERGGYFLSFCHGEMPPHATSHAHSAEDAAGQVEKIADLSEARAIEAE